MLVASNHRTFECDVRALVEHLCSQEDCSHSGRFIRGSVGARQPSRKVVNILSADSSEAIGIPILDSDGSK